MKIEVWSDVVCPWCYIGKRHLEAALAEVETDEPVEIVYRSFELDMGMRKTVDKPMDEILSRKYGVSLGQAQQMIDNVTTAASKVGLAFDLNNAKTGNTYDAHRLIHFAREHGLGVEMKERLMKAYFTEGEPVSDVNTLIQLAESVGLDRTETETVLNGTAFGQAVRDEEALAIEQGVRGVPYFVINDTIRLSGAQPTATFVDALRLSSANASNGESCSLEGC